MAKKREVSSKRKDSCNCANRFALKLGLLFAAFHLIWALLVLAELAEGLLSWFSAMNFVEIPFIVLPFNFVTLLVKLAITFVFGYVLGWILAKVFKSECSM
jgi:hypothetical protein